MKWARRNEDKPHRCPECHRISLRAWLDRYGPRTRLTCSYCAVQWRAASRKVKLSMRSTRRIYGDGPAGTRADPPPGTRLRSK